MKTGVYEQQAERILSAHSACNEEHPTTRLQGKQHYTRRCTEHDTEHTAKHTIARSHPLHP